MKAITCEMCGGTGLVKKDGFYVCQYCGTQYAPEEVEVSTIQAPSTQKPVRSAELENLYELAQKAKSAGEYWKASQYYKQILAEEPGSWEALFYSGYCRAIGCPIEEIAPSAELVADNFIPSCDLIEGTGRSEAWTVDKIRLVGSEALRLGDAFVKSAVDHYRHISSNKRREARKDYNARLLATCKLFGAVATVMERYFDADGGCIERYLHAHKSTVYALNKMDTGWSKPVEIRNKINVSEARIRRFEPDYGSQDASKPSASAGASTTEQSESSGCGCLFFILIILFVLLFMH